MPGSPVCRPCPCPSFLTLDFETDCCACLWADGPVLRSLLDFESGECRMSREGAPFTHVQNFRISLQQETHVWFLIWGPCWEGRAGLWCFTSGAFPYEPRTLGLKSEKAQGALPQPLLLKLRSARREGHTEALRAAAGPGQPNPELRVLGWTC